MLMLRLRSIYRTIVCILPEWSFRTKPHLLISRNSLTDGTEGLLAPKFTLVSPLFRYPLLLNLTWPLDVLDGGMITLAFYCMNIFHPGCLLGNGKEWKRTNSLETIQVDATEEKKRSNESYAPSAV